MWGQMGALVASSAATRAGGVAAALGNGWRRPQRRRRRRDGPTGAIAVVLAGCTAAVATAAARIRAWTTPGMGHVLAAHPAWGCLGLDRRRSELSSRATKVQADLTDSEVLVEEINEIASTTRHHHSATAAAAAAAGAMPGALSAAAVAAPRRGRRALQPVLTLPGDTLEVTPLMLALTAAATAVSAGVVAMSVSRSPAGACFGVIGGVVAAELFSGCFHWATDNYGSLQTPVVGSACAAFQGHHLAPWTIASRPFVNNVYKIARAALVLVCVAAASLPPAGAAFATTMFYGQLLAQDFHRWSHTPASSLAPWQRWLQRCGFALSTAEHCRHHKPPFAAHYCILSGALNRLLDSRPVLLWRRLEALVFRLTSIEPNCWKGEKGASIRELALSL